MNSPVLNPLARRSPWPNRWSRPWLAFGVCLLIGLVVTWRAAATRSERARAAAHAEARARLAALELGFAGAFRAVELIAHSVREGNGRTPDFQRIAADLLRQHPALATIELQPGGVTTEVAPRAGHERLVGRNLMADPVGREAALFSLQLRSVTVTGPTVLTDGQLGLLVRQPVFLGAGPGREQPWGFVTAAARFLEPLRNARFEELTAAGYQFSLFTTAAPLQPAGTVLSTFRALPTDALIQTLRLANLELRLAIRPKAGWHNPWLIAFHALLALALAAAVGGTTHWRQAARAASLACSEADLRAARDNDRFRALFDTIPDAALLVDRQGTVQRVNSAAEQLFAKRAAEIGGQSINTIVPGLAALLTAASRSLTQPAIHLTGLRAGTVEFPVEIRVTPLPSADSGSLICCWIREVAAAPPAPPAPTSVPAPAPETKTANVQPLLDAIPHPVFVKDANARFVTCNRAYETTFGLTADSLRGKTVLELEDLPEETRRNFYAEDQAVIAEGSQRSYELPIVRADGSARSVIYAVAGYRLPEGGPSGLVGVLTDITPQKEAEQERRKLAAELERARLLSETVLELTGFASWRVPLDGSGTFHSSPPAAALMGDPPQPAHHYRLREHWFAHARAADEVAAQAALAQLDEVTAGHRATYDATYAYRRPADGRLVWLRATGRLIKDDAGRPLEIFGVVRDITESKRLEAELEAARAQAREASLALAAALAAPQAMAPMRSEGEASETEELSRAAGATADGSPPEQRPDTNSPSKDPEDPLKAEPIAASGQSVMTGTEQGEGNERSEPDVAMVAGSPMAPPAATRPGDQAEVVPPNPSLRPEIAEEPSRQLPDSQASTAQEPAQDGSPARTSPSHQAEVEIPDDDRRAESFATAGEVPSPVTREASTPAPESPPNVLRPSKPTRRRRTPRDEQLSLFGTETSSAVSPNPPGGGPGPRPEEVVVVTERAETPPAVAAPPDAAPAGIGTDASEPAKPARLELEAPSASELDSIETPSPGEAVTRGEKADIISSADRSGEPDNPPTGSRAAATEADEPLAIAGLDTVEGLRRAGGDERIFLKRLRQFVEQHTHAADEIRDSLIQGDPAGAEKVANHLTRAAEEIGAAELARTTAGLARAMQEGLNPAEIENRWAATERLLGELVQELRPLAKSRPERLAPREEPAAEFSPAEWRRVAHQMLPLLVDADPGAKDCLSANRDLLRSAFPAGTFAEFELRVTGSQYADALDLLKKVAKRRGVPLH